MHDQVADVADGDGVDTREGLVQQDEMGIGGERPGDLHPAAFAAGEGQRRGAAQVGNGEFRQQRLQNRLPPVARFLHHLEHGADVVLHGQAAEDGRFLGKVSDAQPRPAIHGQFGDIFAVQVYGPVVGRQKPHDNVETRCLAGAVRPQETHDFAALDGQADAAHHGALLEAFAYGFGE